MNHSSESHRCAEVVVVGAGVAGLSTAIALARAGVPVDVLERDRASAPAGRRAAGSWRRTGVPHANHAHAFSPGCRRLLEQQCPDVLTRLFDVGARELVLRAPDGGERRAFGVRRPVFDWVLRRVAEREPLLRVYDGVAATGVRRGPDGLSGVMLSGGGVLPASVVVDATGAAGLSRAWLAELGPPVPPASSLGPVKRVRHFSRDYVRRWPGDPTALNLGAAAGGDLPGYTCRVVPGDNHTFTVTFAAPAGGLEEQNAGRRWLAGLGTTAGFDTAARLVPVVSEWVDPAGAEPLGPVHTLSTPRPGARRVLSRPELPGLFAVGDAWSRDDQLPTAYGRAGNGSGRAVLELGDGRGVAGALASAGACAQAVHDVLSGNEPDVASIGAALEGHVLMPTGFGHRLAGPSVAELAELLRRVPGASAVPA